MKREAHGHTKMKRLCKNLSLPLWGAVGILESLWKLTAQEAPQGDVGKLSDEDIALGIEWKGEPKALIDALVDAKWLDRAEPHRLTVHDWHEHSDDSLDMKLARCGKVYANGYTPRMSKLSKDERTKICQLFGWSGAGVLVCGTKRHEKALPVTSHQSPAPAPEPGAAPAPPAAEEPPPSLPAPRVQPVTSPDPDAGGEFALANWALEEIGVPAEPGLIRIAAECIRLLAKEGGTLKQATEFIAFQAREARSRGDTINRFWFSDQRYRGPTKSRKQLEREAARKAFLEAT